MIVSYKQKEIESCWDAIVIGSGIGGLGCAALLSLQAGKRVLVLERHYTAGGYTHAFRRPGYEWDVGVHYVGEMQNRTARGRASQVRAAFDYVTRGQLNWEAMPDVYDRIRIGGRNFEFQTGATRFRERLIEYFPAEERGITRYLAAVRSAQRASGLYFAEKAIPRPVARLAGSLMRAPFRRWSDRTTFDVLREFTNNDELIGLLTAQWGDYGLPPRQSSFGMHAIIVDHYLEGASYPVGGASRIAETIAPAIEQHGGKVVVGADVAEVIVENGKALGIRMGDGREFRAPVVISDAGARNTFERLLKPAQGMPSDSTASMAHLSLYVGLRHSAAELGLTGTNLWIHPSFDHDANLRKFAEDPAGPFPVLFVSFPSAKDPWFERRHPGRATVEVVTTVPYSWFERWESTRWKKRPEEYEALKRQLASRLKSELEGAVPAIAGKIDYAELSTPLSTRHFMNYQSGEAYGVAATPARFRSRAFTPHTSVRNLYLTGQDVVSAGLAGALMGGVISASAVLGRNVLGAVTKGSTKGSERAPQSSSKIFAW